MARQRSKRSSGPSETGKWIAIALIIALSLVLAGAGSYWWISTPKATVRDRVTMCPATDPTNILVVLLDTSDGLPSASKDEVFTYLKDLVEAQPIDTLVDVRSLDPAFQSGRPILILCNPGNGEGLSEFNGNPELAKRRWREKFWEPMFVALSGGLQQLPSKTSPILQTLQGIAIDRFTGSRVEKAKKQLVVVSDMIEFGTEYSQYPPADVSYRRFKSMPIYKKLRTNLYGAEVTIFYVQRTTTRPLNSAQHIQFWLDWIADNNGIIKNAIKLQGVGKS